ncbi:MAG TPA: zinc ABC transporter substrate-binding protein [Candidatus Megaira endosymbiont of Nemacystus decipiens]|nr:zinc ABC transporter substrate-binding protein [Candidatus Megaera endosymbiont of Nemacystus decipiens]
MIRIKNLLLILTLICLHANVYSAPLKIVTSTKVLASIVFMLTKDQAKIEVLNEASGCPHHYVMKPSDKRKLDDADYFIYIDDKFDSFSKKAVANFKGSVIKISAFNSINFHTAEGKIDWHFWLDLDNVIALSSELSRILLTDSHFQKNKNNILQNHANLKEELNILKSQKKEKLSQVYAILLGSTSLEHFFNNTNVKVIRLPELKLASLKKYEYLQNLMQNNSFPIVIDTHQNISLYNKYNHTIITLNSEDWSLTNSKIQTGDLFIYYYSLLINQF